MKLTVASIVAVVVFDVGFITGLIWRHHALDRLQNHEMRQRRRIQALERSLDIAVEEIEDLQAERDTANQASSAAYRQLAAAVNHPSIRHQNVSHLRVVGRDS